MGHGRPGEVQVDRARLLPRRERARGRVRPVIERVAPEPRGLAARGERDGAAGRAPVPHRHQTRPRRTLSHSSNFLADRASFIQEYPYVEVYAIEPTHK